MIIFFQLYNLKCLRSSKQFGAAVVLNFLLLFCVVPQRVIFGQLIKALLLRLRLLNPNAVQLLLKVFLLEFGLVPTDFWAELPLKELPRASRLWHFAYIEVFPV